MVMLARLDWWLLETCRGRMDIGITYPGYRVHKEYYFVTVPLLQGYRHRAIAGAVRSYSTK